MRFIVSRTWLLCVAISLLGCGIRGPLTLPTIPPAPTHPEKAEPTGKQWPPAKDSK
ncbi:lipoprotein [Polynucleobacter sp. AM-26B4]|uniref:LPS translocon maturation chaperone LptM n=1 Tax=Polynucleobacter sp. AM-26B4 TaxID=2689103 RepID=UPI001CAA8350|nr:lipoprotein [Polynucleobacter sp. AM-26B4]